MARSLVTWTMRPTSPAPLTTGMPVGDAGRRPAVDLEGVVEARHRPGRHDAPRRFGIRPVTGSPFACFELVEALDGVVDPGQLALELGDALAELVVLGLQSP